MAKKRTKKKTSPKADVPTVPTVPTVDPMPQALLDRAKKLGVDPQSYTIPEKLKEYLDMVSPETNPDALPKKAVVPTPIVIRNPIKKKAPTEVPLHKDNFRDERKAIEHLVRGINVKFSNPPMTTIVKTVVYDCQTRQVTGGKYEIIQRKD